MTIKKNKYKKEVLGHTLRITKNVHKDENADVIVIGNYQDPLGVALADYILDILEKNERLKDLLSTFINRVEAQAGLGKKEIRNIRAAIAGEKC